MMKTQSKEYQWVFVFGLIIVALITAVALGDERPSRADFRGRRSASQTEQPAPAERPDAAAGRRQPTARPTATPSRDVQQSPSQTPGRSLFRSNTAPQATASAQTDARRSVTTRSRPAERAVERSQERTLERLSPPGTSTTSRSALRRPDTATRQPATTIQRRAVAPDRQTAAPTADVNTTAGATRSDRNRTVERIGRPADRMTATATSQKTTDTRSDGFVYRGSAWYDRNRSRTADDSSIQRHSRSDSDPRPERNRRTASDRVTRLTGRSDRISALATPQTQGGDDNIDRVSRLSVDSDRRSRPSRRSSSTYSSETLRSDSRSRSSSVRRSHRHSSQVVINGDNNVIVQGHVTTQQTRPYIPPRRVTSISYIHSSPHWRSYGSSFVFSWSNRSCGVLAVVPHYDYYGVTYYYPRYHRRFVFVSLGGHWPSYRYVRYYWYGAHPYYWYGPQVVSAPVTHNTYNTYNTYTTAPQSSRPSTTYAVGGDYQFDPTVDDFSDIREKMAAEQQAVDAPHFQTAADLAFDNAVKLFEAGNFEDAARQFLEAIELSPDDSILPFTYTQALFASGDYAAAADVLRAAMARMPEDEPTVYYPRGLYEDDATLTSQIAALQAALTRQPDNADYQLLLGYQFLGVGELEEATALLTQAGSHESNAETTAKLLDLVEQLKTAQ